MPDPAAARALDSLPHGPGFRFLDEVVDLDPGRSARARYRVRGDEPVLAGHFPGNPLLPGVILIEAVAQLAGVAAQSDPAVPPLNDLRLTAVRAAKILDTAGPGTVIEIEATIAGRLGPLVQATGSVSANGRPLLSTQLTLAGR